MTGLVAQAQHNRDDGPEEPTPQARRSALIGLLVVLALVALAVVTDNVVYVLGFLIFTVGLLVSVVLHEAGHFVMARRFGMKATQFFVGFGPTLFSRQRGETEYGIKAVPAGGFVKIIGMTPLEEVDAGDEDRAFFRFPARQKTAVLVAGSTMHGIIALVLVFGSVFLIGSAQEVSPAVGRLTQCVAPDVARPAGATDQAYAALLDDQAGADPCTRPGSVPAPAVAAGLRVGDVVTAVDGRAVGSAAELTAALRAGADRPLPLAVTRGDERLQLTVTPALLERQLTLTERQSVGTIGISVQQRQDAVREGFTGSVGASVDTMQAFAAGIRTTVTEKLPSITSIYSKDRDPQGFIGIVGAGRISGEVLESQETSSFKAVNLILVLASLNLFVGLFNLLPLLPLDGGHIAVVWFESARDRIRRFRGYQGAIQRVDYTKLLPVTYVVAGTFAVFTVLLIGADIVNPVRITT